AARVHHRVDGAAPAHASTGAHEEPPAGAFRLRHAEALEHEALVHERALVTVGLERLGVLTGVVSALEQEHAPRRVSRELARNDGSGGAAADDDVVELEQLARASTLRRGAREDRSRSSSSK